MTQSGADTQRGGKSKTTISDCVPEVLEVPVEWLAESAHGCQFGARDALGSRRPPQVVERPLRGI